MIPLLVVNTGTVCKAISSEDSLKITNLLDSAEANRRKGMLANALNISVRNVRQLKELKADPNLKTRTYVDVSMSLRLLGASQDAIGYLYKAIHVHTKEINGYNDQDAIMFGTIGSYHLSENRLDSAILIFKKAVAIMATQNRPLYHASAYNNLGLAYSNTKDLDSAMIAFNKGMELLDLNNHEQASFSGVILENMSDVQVLKKEYPAALALVQQSIAAVANSKDKLAAHYHQLIQIKGMSRTAIGLENDIDSFFKYRRHMPDKTRHQYTCNILGVQERLGVGNAVQLNRRLRQHNDSLIGYLKAINSNITLGLTNYKLSILQQQNTINELERKESEQALQIERNRVRRFQLIGIFLLILFGAIIYILTDRANKKRKRVELEQKMAGLELQNQRLKEHKMAEEIERKKNDILNLALDNAKKLEWNNELINKIKGLRKADEKDINKTLRDIEIQMGQQLQADRQAEVLKTNIDKVNQEFNDKLLLKYPSLTRSELELCGFLKLRLSGQEIASIRNVDPKSITKAKQRLKKKMELKAGEDLYQVLHKI